MGAGRCTQPWVGSAEVTKRRGCELVLVGRLNGVTTGKGASVGPIGRFGRRLVYSSGGSS